MMTKEEEDLDWIVENTWRNAEKVFHRGLLHLAEQLKHNKTMSASDGLREMAKMFEHAEPEVCVQFKRKLN